MIIDAITKEFRCPVCNTNELLYIDLNLIKSDPRANTGIVRRSFSHNNHSLLLDIDLHGSIRTINRIEEKTNQTIVTHETLKDINLQSYFVKYNSILMLSSDPIITELILREIKYSTDNDNNFSIDISNSHIRLSLGENKLIWIRDYYIPKELSYDLIIFDSKTNLKIDFLKNFKLKNSHVFVFTDYFNADLKIENMRIFGEDESIITILDEI